MNAPTEQSGAALLTPPPRTLILGLGETGLSCARFLARRGVPLAVADTRERPPALARLQEELPDVPVFLGGFPAEAFARAERIVASPGVPLATPTIQAALARGTAVIGDIELFAHEVRAPVVAVTGSNGKSTVVTLLGEMARAAGRDAAVGGNLGTPALDLLAPEHELYVLELSSFQLETTASLRPRAAAVLNVSPDHLDRYPDLETYTQAKARIYRGAGTGVINRDDPRVGAMRGRASRELGFGLDRAGPDDFRLGRRHHEDWLWRGATPLLPVARMGLSGRHNLANALAALALGEAVGLPMPAMLEALRRFRGLPHRTQRVAERRGVQWYDDSKGTNPGATIAALEGLHDGRPGTLLIAGGLCKDADFGPLAEAAARTCRAVILIGRDAPVLRQALHGRIPLLLGAPTLEAAVAQAADIARPGERVLLSPACASFDMFSGFAHRGRVFAQAVEGLAP